MPLLLHTGVITLPGIYLGTYTTPHRSESDRDHLLIMEWSSLHGMNAIFSISPGPESSWHHCKTVARCWVSSAVSTLSWHKPSGHPCRGGMWAGIVCWTRRSCCWVSYLMGLGLNRNIVLWGSQLRRCLVSLARTQYLSWPATKTPHPCAPCSDGMI